MANRQNMALTESGIKPGEFWQKEFRKLLVILNSEALGLESKLVKGSPTGISSTLKQAWFVRPATQNNPVAEVANSQSYLLPLELGRMPGKGISAEGQLSVAEWARVKLGLSPQDSKGLAFVLSRKYKAEGRPAEGFIGLVEPGTTPSQEVDLKGLEPVAGSTLGDTFRQLRARLEAA